MRQLEFYFGDINLIKDDFLKNLIRKHKKGYVEVRALLKFKKIKKIFQSFSIEGTERAEILSESIDNSEILCLNK